MQELEPRRGGRVPGHGGDAHPHQVEDAAAAARDPPAVEGGGGSARRAGPPAARAPEVQGGRRAAARARALRAAQWQRPDERVAEIAGDEYEPELEVDLFSLLAAFQAVLRAREAAAEGAAAARADPGRGAHRAAAGAAVGDRGVRVRGSVRRRATTRRPDRHVPGAARDDSTEAGARVPVGRFGPIRVYKRARPADAPHPIGDPEGNRG